MAPFPGLIDSSDSSSSLSDDSEQERLREFARRARSGATEEAAPSERANSINKKNTRKVRRLSMRNALRKNVRKVVGKKSVSFVCDKRLFEFHCVEAIGELKNIDLIWFTSDELVASKKDAQRLADALEVKASLHGVVGDEDWRGLESHGEEGHWKAYKARSDVKNAVLDVQDEFKAPRMRRRQSNATDGTTLMAKAAREISVVFADEAVERARQDAECAEEYCQDIVAMIQAIPLARRLPEQPVSQKKDAPRGRVGRMRFSITGRH